MYDAKTIKSEYCVQFHHTYVTGFAKTVPSGTRIEIPFIAWHES